MTKRYKAHHLENPTLPIKSQSGLLVVTFESTKELIRHILHQKEALEVVRPV